MGTFEKHREAILSGCVDAATVRGVRNILNAVERRNIGASVSRGSAKLTSAQAAELLELIETHKPRVTGELHASGLKVLRNRRYAKRLQAYADVIDDINHFRLLGFRAFGRMLTHHTPVYAAYNSRGQRLRFINIPWQSGGDGPEIVYTY